MATEITDIKDILRLIDEENVKLEAKVYVPSLDKEVQVKPLNSNHSKNILKSAIDGPFSDNQFSMVAYAILNEIWDRSISLAKVNVYDKTLILLQLRALNIAKDVEVEFIGTDESRITQKVNIADHVKPFLTATTFDPIVVDDTLEESTPEGPRFTATLDFPSITEEFAFESNLYKTRLSKVNEEDRKALNLLFAPIFTNNVAKYIKSFSVGEKSFDLASRKVDDRLAVVEKLPAIIQDKTMQKIQTHFDVLLKKITSVEVTQKEITYRGDIDIDANLFVGSN